LATSLQNQNNSHLQKKKKMKIKDSFSAASNSLSLYSEYFQQAVQTGEALLTIEEFESTVNDPLSLPFLMPFKDLKDPSEANMELIEQTTPPKKGANRFMELVKPLSLETKPEPTSAKPTSAKPTTPTAKTAPSSKTTTQTRTQTTFTTVQITTTQSTAVPAENQISFEAFINSIQNFNDENSSNYLALNQFDQDLFGEEGLRGVLSRKNSRSLFPHENDGSKHGTPEPKLRGEDKLMACSMAEDYEEREEEEEEDEEEGEAGEHENDHEDGNSSTLSSFSTLTFTESSPPANPLKRKLEEELLTMAAKNEAKQPKIAVGINIGPGVVNPKPATTTIAQPQALRPAGTSIPVERPRKKPGRKPKILDEETRIQRGIQRQEKNRLAARKCREKKQQYYTELEEEIDTLKKEKLAMANKISELEKEVEQLKTMQTL
jgi:hypothetical protein